MVVQKTSESRSITYYQDEKPQPDDPAPPSSQLIYAQFCYSNRSSLTVLWSHVFLQSIISNRSLLFLYYFELNGQFEQWTDNKAGALRTCLPSDP